MTTSERVVALGLSVGPLWGPLEQVKFPLSEKAVTYSLPEFNSLIYSIYIYHGFSQTRGGLVWPEIRLSAETSAQLPSPWYPLSHFLLVFSHLGTLFSLTGPSPWGSLSGTPPIQNSCCDSADAITLCMMIQRVIKEPVLLKFTSTLWALYLLRNFVAGESIVKVDIKN